MSIHTRHRQPFRGSPISYRSNGSQWSVRRNTFRLISKFFHPAKTPSYLQPTASTAQRAASSAPSKASKRSRHPTTTRHVPPQSHAPLPHSKDAPSTLGDGSSSKGELKSSVPKSRVVSSQAIARTNWLPTCCLSFQTGAPVGQLSHPPPAEGHTVQPEPDHDTLQVAAQVQSWLFMQSNLQDCLSMVQKGVQVYCSATLRGFLSLTFLGHP